MYIYMYIDGGPLAEAPSSNTTRREPAQRLALRADGCKKSQAIRLGPSRGSYHIMLGSQIARWLLPPLHIDRWEAGQFDRRTDGSPARFGHATRHVVH